MAALEDQIALLNVQQGDTLTVTCDIARRQIIQHDVESRFGIEFNWVWLTPVESVVVGRTAQNVSVPNVTDT